LGGTAILELKGKKRKRSKRSQRKARRVGCRQKKVPTTRTNCLKVGGKAGKPKGDEGRGKQLRYEPSRVRMPWNNMTETGEKDGVLWKRREGQGEGLPPPSPRSGEVCKKGGEERCPVRKTEK